MDGKAIQVLYYNEFGSVWEYHRAFLCGEIDWAYVLRTGCPLCGSRSCWRELTPYYRWAVDLLPFREQRIPIARFFCRKTKATFSMLPVQLAPYHRYTERSIVFCLLLAAAGQDEGLSLFCVAERQVEPESKITGWLIATWLALVVRGFRRARPELKRWFGSLDVKTGYDQAEELVEVASTCRALRIRAPPHIESLDWLDEVIGRYCLATGKFLFGTPSQERARHGLP